ncbi:MAG TPA: hypothetical protein VN026_07675 [Bacteroidia bacterium]|jgi:hypothetical protein|nr:hypothetical protein [Bacteroidia bacterium]
MATKEKPTNVNTNNNVNNNTNNIHIHVPEAKSTLNKNDSDIKWYKRKLIWGITALILSVSAYYIKKQMDLKSSVNPTIIQTSVPPVVETTSLTNNK